jgi:hypothetical protein
VSGTRYIITIAREGEAWRYRVMAGTLTTRGILSIGSGTCVTRTDAYNHAIKVLASRRDINHE